MTAPIVTTGLTKHFGGTTAVDHLDLNVPTGAVFALLGDNGAGKTTVIRMLMGLLLADAGRAEILGKDCWRNAVALRQQVGYVPERPRYYDWMTVTEIGWFVAGFYKAGFQPRFLDLIHRFRVEAHKKLSQLTKGGYAKLGLALALAHEPEVLILDEPTSGLDLFTRRDFLASMVDLAGAGRTILLSSHQIAEVERVASHVAFLSEGKLLLSATLEEIRQQIVRYRWTCNGTAATEPVGLGHVLHRSESGRQWEVIIRHPRQDALEVLRKTPGILDAEQMPLPLEEVYAVLLGRSASEVDLGPTATEREGGGQP